MKRSHFLMLGLAVLTAGVLAGCESAQPSGEARSFRAAGSGSAKKKDDRGDLTVILLPPKAVELGARWRLAGTEEWYLSDTLVTLPADTYTLEFTNVTGFQSPLETTATVTAGGDKVHKAKYRQ